MIFQSGADKVEITAGSVDLRSDDTWVSSITFRTTFQGVTETETETESGTYSVSGSTVTFSSSGTSGGTVTGTLAGGRLTVTEEGVILVFEK